MMGTFVMKEFKVNQTLILYIYWNGAKKEKQLRYLCSSLSNYKVQIGTLELSKNINKNLVKFEIKYSFEVKVALKS